MLTNGFKDGTIGLASAGRMAVPLCCTSPSIWQSEVLQLTRFLSAPPLLNLDAAQIVAHKPLQRRLESVLLNYGFKCWSILHSRPLAQWTCYPSILMEGYQDKKKGENIRPCNSGDYWGFYAVINSSELMSSQICPACLRVQIAFSVFIKWSKWKTRTYLSE